MSVAGEALVAADDRRASRIVQERVVGGRGDAQFVCRVMREERCGIEVIRGLGFRCQANLRYLPRGQCDFRRGNSFCVGAGSEIANRRNAAAIHGDVTAGHARVVPGKARVSACACLIVQVGGVGGQRTRCHSGVGPGCTPEIHLPIGDRSVLPPG